MASLTDTEYKTARICLPDLVMEEQQAEEGSGIVSAAHTTAVPFFELAPHLHNRKARGGGWRGVGVWVVGWVAKVGVGGTAMGERVVLA